MIKKVIMIVGGGSGGHLTPIVAVAESLKGIDKDIKVVHVGQKGEGLQEVVNSNVIDVSYAITAGKFRRYHGESLLAHLLDVKTLLLNLRDFFRFIFGTFEAWRLLGRVKPQSIMLKGGFVSVPVGYAARLRKIPYLTHDSDAVPGLANRLTAKHAVYNTTALPADVYPYEESKTIQVGIPIRKEYTEVKLNDLGEYKKKIGFPLDSKILFCVGGGLGAQRINHALAKASNEILTREEKAVIIHLTGKKLYAETKKLYAESLSSEQMNNIVLIDFTNELFNYSAAADVVLTRGGATNIAEFAAQAKPCIVVPAPHLTGGQQLHNAKVLEDNNAAVVLLEESLHRLDDTVIDLMNQSASERNSLGKALHKLAVYDSADKLAILLTEIAEEKL
jgi:UDP-N-acetylglucosamine--N-acetylmuramyl-(pentapeptide) pyrophosphoryl-undecaprenol N-acetylglucosamine transferase